jgi:heme oxygenase
VSKPRVPSARERLRRATDAAHQRLHSLEVFAAIADGTLTVDGYRGLLQSLFLFHSTVGAGAADYGWSALSSAPRRRALLQRDLRFFGLAGPSVTAAWLPRSPHATLGALYAAEGSIFGGRVIAGQLDFLLGSSLDGRRFFVGFDGDGQRWGELLAVIETQCATKAALDQAIEGALFAFDLFEQCVVASQPIAYLTPATAICRERQHQLTGARPI